MIPIAPLARELRLEGAGSVVIGVGGLVASIALGASPARALVPFAVAAVALAAVQAAIGHRWYVGAVADAGPPDEDATIETPQDTTRRTLVKLSVYVLLVVILLIVGREFGAVLGGLLVGIGLVDLYTSRWAERLAADGETIYRELGSWPFASGRRPLYRRMSASTEAM